MNPSEESGIVTGWTGRHLHLPEFGMHQLVDTVAFRRVVPDKASHLLFHCEIDRFNKIEIAHRHRAQPPPQTGHQTRPIHRGHFLVGGGEGGDGCHITHLPVAEIGQHTHLLTGAGQAQYPGARRIDHNFGTGGGVGGIGPGPLTDPVAQYGVGNVGLAQFFAAHMGDLQQRLFQ